MKESGTADVGAWLPLGLVLGWIAATAPWSPRVTAVGLAVIVAGAAVARGFFPPFAPLVVRARVVDVAILATLAVGLGFLGVTAHIG